MSYYFVVFTSCRFNSFYLWFWFFSFLSLVWIGGQFPQDNFLSYGRILTLHYYFLLMCILFSYEIPSSKKARGFHEKKIKEENDWPSMRSPLTATKISCLKVNAWWWAGRRACPRLFDRNLSFICWLVVDERVKIPVPQVSQNEVMDSLCGGHKVDHVLFMNHSVPREPKKHSSALSGNGSWETWDLPVQGQIGWGSRWRGSSLF